MDDDEQQDDEPDHTEDPRRQGVAAGGYPEVHPAPDRKNREARDAASSEDRDGDPGQATGNPNAAGADPKWRDGE